MNKENIVMTGADYARLMGSLNLLFDAVKEMSGVLMGYESTGFISPDSLKTAQEQASEAEPSDEYDIWLRKIKEANQKIDDSAVNFCANRIHLYTEKIFEFCPFRTPQTPYLL